ncbi:hypothetical protein [Undibacterium flavidum]|uniref:Uncharacterized protein n=1 Tax=Undibacterium flavidum TaxID=2762297 RepID=A0ABR6YDD0_9BURK|nr:hypothetical protein [Undibacterium flavidum]MBC3874543.1 hypothetical protein [Undibacterium flavidum]
MLRKILLRSVLGLVVLIVSLVLLFLIANWRDDTLRPEVREAMQWQAPKIIEDDNAYLLLLGLNARDTVDPLILGKRKLIQQIQDYEKNGVIAPEYSERVADPDEIEILKPKLEVCDHTNTPDCVAFYLARSIEKEREIINSHKTLLKNFERLKVSSNFREIHPPTISASSPNYAPYMYAAELARMQAIRLIANGKPSEGINDLLQIAVLTQNILEHADTLILHTIALANLQKDLRILEEVLRRFPELNSDRKNIAKYLKELSQDPVGIAKVFKFERQYGLQIWMKIYESQSENELDRWEDKILSYFQLPNATLNTLYDWKSLWINGLKEPRVSYSQTKLRIEEQRKTLLGFGIENIYLRNPVSKILLFLHDEGYGVHFERHDDVIAQAHILAIKLEILERGISKSEIPQFVKNHPAQQAIQLDGRPILWDAEKQQLLFELRQPFKQGFQNEKIYRVQLPL